MFLIPPTNCIESQEEGERKVQNNEIERVREKEKETQWVKETQGKIRIENESNISERERRQKIGIREEENGSKRDILDWERGSKKDKGMRKNIEKRYSGIREREQMEKESEK